MSNITKGAAPNPYGRDGRKVFLPVKATTQVYQGGMAAQVSGACVPMTSTGAGNCVGVFESDMLGGASDGSTRVSVWTDKIFIFKAGVNAPTDATPFGSILFAEDDNSVGTGGVGGAAEGVAGRFMGIEDDGKVRVWVGTSEAFENYLAKNGAAATDTATETVNVVAGARVTRIKVPTLSQATTITLGTTGAVVGDIIRLVRVGTDAHTLTVVDGGTGTPTLFVLVASKQGWAQAYFDGTNWQSDGCSAT